MEEEASGERAHHGGVSEEAAAGGGVRATAAAGGGAEAASGDVPAAGASVAGASSNDNRNEEFLITDLDMEHKVKIGQGAFGAVYLVQEYKQKRHVVLKTPTYDVNEREIREEMEKMKLIRMDHVVEVFGLVHHDDGEACGFIMEYVQLGSVYDIVMTHLREKLPWALQLRVLLQTAIGIQYLHDNNMLHLDLKTANILLDWDCKVKITDFGSAVVRNSVETNLASRRPGPASIQASEDDEEASPKGPIAFMAPEVLRDGNTAPSRKWDVYAFAITMWEVLTGEFPFKMMRDDTAIINQVLRGIRPEPAKVPQSTDEEKKVLNIMRRCWDGNSIQRPFLADACVLPELRYLSDSRAQQANKDAEEVRKKVECKRPVVVSASANQSAVQEESTEDEAENRVAQVHTRPDPKLFRGLSRNYAPFDGLSPNHMPQHHPASGEETERHKLETQQKRLSGLSLNLSEGGGGALGGADHHSFHPTGLVLHSILPESLFVEGEEDVVSDEDLHALAPYIAHRWQEFARHLRLTPEELAGIAEQTPVPPGEQARVGTPHVYVKLGLRMWKSKFGYQAIRKWILAVLVHMEMWDLSHILRHEPPT